MDLTNFVISHMHDYVFDVIADGHQNILEFLITQGLNVNYIKDSKSLLYQATICRQNKIFLLLVRHGANLHTINNNILHILCEYGDFEMVTFLIDHNVDPNSLNSKNETPLFIATKYRHYDIIKLLLSHGVACNYGSFHMAVTNNDLEIVQLFLDHGADVHEVKNFDTTLKIAVQNNNFDIIQILLQYGANANIIDIISGKYLLSYCKSVDSMKLLIEFGADINYHEGFLGYTCLHKAIIDNKIEIIKFLSKYPVVLNTQDYLGETPLFSAIKKQNIGITQILLEAGADLNIPDKNGITPKSLSYELKNEAIIKLIEDYESLEVKNVEE